MQRIVIVKFVKRYWWQTVGALALGTVTSALWDFVFKPLLPALGGAMLTVSTLGMHSLRDEVYLEVAKGLHEDNSLSVAIIVFTCLSIYPITVAFSSSSSPLVAQGGEGTTIEELEKAFAEAQQKRARFRRVAGLLGILICVFGLYQTARALYVNRAIAYFRQTCDAAGPYLSADEQKRILADFATMRGRSDYVAVTAHLESAIQQHGGHTPEFSIW